MRSKSLWNGSIKVIRFAFFLLVLTSVDNSEHKSIISAYSLSACLVSRSSNVSTRITDEEQILRRKKISKMKVTKSRHCLCHYRLWMYSTFLFLSFLCLHTMELYLIFNFHMLPPFKRRDNSCLGIKKSFFLVSSIGDRRSGLRDLRSEETSGGREGSLFVWGEGRWMTGKPPTSHSPFSLLPDACSQRLQSRCPFGHFDRRDQSHAFDPW